ncbi:MAG: SPFH domain-containing protein [Legionellales bacterium]
MDRKYDKLVDESKYDSSSEARYYAAAAAASSSPPSIVSASTAPLSVSPAPTDAAEGFLKVPMVDGLQAQAKSNPFVLENDTKLIDDMELPEVSLERVIVSAPHDDSTGAQATRILLEFNRDIDFNKGESAFTESLMRGKPVPQGTFSLAERNGRVELHGASTTPIARSLSAAVGIKSEIISRSINQSDKFYGKNGKFVLNVPVAHYAKAISGNNPVIYGPGCHVIIDANFRFEDKAADVKDQVSTGEVSQSEWYINHGQIHILRVPANKFAKIWIGSDPHVLPGRSRPYAFNDPNIRIVWQAEKNTFFDQSENYINHGNIHILRVQQGRFAKVWVGQDAYFLSARKEPYVIKDPQFRLERHANGDFLFDQAEHYIPHGNKHILRIPQGKYAKVWIGNDAILLKHQSLPYYIDHPVFKLELNKDRNFLFDLTDFYIAHGTQHFVRVPEGKIAKIWVGSAAILLEKGFYQYNDPTFKLDVNDGDLFYNATQRLITHGNIKRVIPHTGEVGISYDNGKLTILKPNSDGRPHLITSSTHEVSGFLETGIETWTYPSEKTKAELRKENPKLSTEQVSHLRFTTQDSLPVGVKLLVAFSVSEPEKALTKLLSREGILTHIENLATVDMGKAIQKCSSQEFLNFSQTQPGRVSAAAAEKPRQPMHYQDEVKKALAEDLEEYGIQLIRLNVETPKILDEQIASQMAQSSIQSAQANATEATLEQRFRIAKRQAEQEAEQKRVAQEQTNETLITAAKAQRDAAELKKQATIAEAEAEKQSIVLRAQAEAEAIRLKAEAQREAMTVQGQALQAHPGLLELELAKVKASAMEKMNISVTSAELANMLARGPFSMFSGSGWLPAASTQPLRVEQDRNAARSTTP